MFAEDCCLRNHLIWQEKKKTNKQRKEKKKRKKKVKTRERELKKDIVYSWLATMWQGGYAGGVLVVNTIELSLVEVTWK